MTNTPSAPVPPIFPVVAGDEPRAVRDDDLVDDDTLDPDLDPDRIDSADADYLATHPDARPDDED